jgi:hypothetical protein
MEYLGSATTDDGEGVGVFQAVPEDGGLILATNRGHQSGETVRAIASE